LRDVGWRTRAGREPVAARLLRFSGRPVSSDAPRAWRANRRQPVSLVSAGRGYGDGVSEVEGAAIEGLVCGELTNITVRVVSVMGAQPTGVVSRVSVKVAGAGSGSWSRLMLVKGTDEAAGSIGTVVSVSAKGTGSEELVAADAVVWMVVWLVVGLVGAVYVPSTVRMV